MAFQVSVIIPVYNAEKYIRQAVESTVHIEEVGEVILVEDRSPDKAWEVCLKLSEEFKKVNLHQHPNNENRGAGASRNLGIQKATCDYVAFLDADDYFLSNRFLKTKMVFEKDQTVEGVYDAIGYFKEGDANNFKLFTISKDLNPDSVFHYLIRGTYGHFSTLGITVKKSAFKKSGIFNTTLKLHQDAELWLRLAYYCKLRAGEIARPVAMARRHNQNRISHANVESKLLHWNAVNQHFKNKPIGLLNTLLIDRKIAKIKASKKKTFFIPEFIRTVFERFTNKDA
jgi:glycosyltransferase involved in cell wall biosynthesis